VLSQAIFYKMFLSIIRFIFVFVSYAGSKGPHVVRVVAKKEISGTNGKFSLSISDSDLST